MSAYLCVLLDITTDPPHVVEADIFSSPAQMLTVMDNDTRWVDVTSVDAGSYHESSQELRDYLASERCHHAWVRRFIGRRR